MNLSNVMCSWPSTQTNYRFVVCIYWITLTVESPLTNPYPNSTNIFCVSRKKNKCYSKFYEMLSSLNSILQMSNSQKYKRHQRTKNCINIYIQCEWPIYLMVLSKKQKTWLDTQKFLMIIKIFCICLMGITTTDYRS